MTMDVEAAPMTNWQRFRKLCQLRGLKLFWVAQEIGVAYPTLYGKMNGLPRYAWQPGEKERLTELLNVELSEIWPDDTETAAS